jgi:hypothetical protein
MYLTFSDPNGVWPCIDGVTIEVDHYSSDDSSVQCKEHIWSTKGPIKTFPNPPTCITSQWGAVNIPSCNGLGFYSAMSNCTSQQYDCSRNVNLSPSLHFTDCTCVVTLYLNVYVEQKIFGLCRTFCNDSPNSGTISFFGTANSVYSCNNPLSLTYNYNINNTCFDAANFLYVGFGVNSTGNISFTITE